MRKAITMDRVHVVKSHVLFGGSFPFLVDSSELHCASMERHESARESECTGEGNAQGLGKGHTVDGSKNCGLWDVHD